MGNELPKEPLIFLKPPSSITGPDSPIVLTKYSTHVEHEGELAVIIGKNCSQMGDSEDPLSYVLGYTCLNDISARDLQKSDVQFTRAKGFDTFCPVGPWVSDEIDPADGLDIETRVNGELRQLGSTFDFIFAIPQLLSYITAAITLEPGDLVLTGTPSGVGPLAAGDQVTVAMPGLGVLVNSVAVQPS